jgi:hypothetical protein
LVRVLSAFGNVKTGASCTTNNYPCAWAVVVKWLLGSCCVVLRRERLEVLSQALSLTLN